MKETVLDRIKFLIEINKMSVTSFSKMIGMPQTTVTI